MHMVGYAAHAITFATGVAGDRGEIGVEFGPRVGVEECASVFRTEDYMDDDEAQRLWHDGEFSAKGAFDTSLGQRPRK
jgi:hypothetical protein